MVQHIGQYIAAYTLCMRVCVCVQISLYSCGICTLRDSRQIKSISLFQQRMKAFLAKCDKRQRQRHRLGHRTPENCVNVYILHLQLLSYWILKREWIEMKISPCFANYKIRNKFVVTAAVADDDDNNSDIDDTQKVDFVCANLEDYKFLELIFYCSLFPLILSLSLTHFTNRFDSIAKQFSDLSSHRWFVLFSSLSFFFVLLNLSILVLLFCSEFRDFHFIFRNTDSHDTHTHTIATKNERAKECSRSDGFSACTNTQRSAHVNVCIFTTSIYISWIMRFHC